MNEKTLKYVDFAFAAAIYVAITFGFVILISAIESTYKHNTCIDLLNKVVVEISPGKAKQFTNIEELCDKYSKINKK